MYEQKKQTYIEVFVDRIQIVCTLSNVDILEDVDIIEGGGERRRLLLRAKSCWFAKLVDRCSWITSSRRARY